MVGELDPRNDRTHGSIPRIMNRLVYYKGQTIIEQGSHGNRAYYIETGCVEVTVQEGEHRVKVSELGGGEIFGEMALIQNKPRSATVTAIEDTVITVISGYELEQKIMHIDDPAISALLEVLVDRLKQANRGQLNHYKNLVEYQDRVAGLANQVANLKIDHEDRANFHRQVEPLVSELENILACFKHDIDHKP